MNLLLLYMAPGIAMLLWLSMHLDELYDFFDEEAKAVWDNHPYISRITLIIAFALLWPLLVIFYFFDSNK